MTVSLYRLLFYQENVKHSFKITCIRQTGLQHVFAAHLCMLPLASRQLSPGVV